jgi:type IV pilus assembly protein PilQ
MKKFIFLLFILATNAFAAPVSIDIQSISLPAALKLLAGYAPLNVIISPDVQGTASLRVHNADPVSVLETLLWVHGLAKSVHGEVWFIAPRATMIKLHEEEAERRLNAEAAAGLQSMTMKIRYAKAAELAHVIQGDSIGLLSERGHLSVDARTNMIFIRDTHERLVVVQQLIHRLDIPIKQVLIEARLVSIDQDAEQQLGIDFTVRQPLANTAPQQPLMTGHSEKNGRYSIAIASLPDGSWLDVKLAALEQQGRAELISSPSLFTGSQQEASIEAGEEVPYQEVSESGGTAVAFKKAVLGLTVTPQIMPGGAVLMALKINQDRPSARMVQGVPAISTRQIVTNVQVRSGQTIVLGGIYEVNHEQSQEGVPVLGNIPIIGLLFTQRSKRDNKRELLIFVTPKIMPQAI